MTSTILTELLRSIIALKFADVTTEYPSKTALKWISVANQLAAREPEAALLALDEALRVDPGSWGAYNNRALLKHAERRYADAMADYDAAISAHPEKAVLYLNRAGTKLELNLFDDSIADYSAAIRLEPNWAGAFGRRGAARYKMGEHNLALKDFDRAIVLDPEDPEGYLNRGAVKEGIGQLEEASADYDMALKLDPRLVQAYYGRGNVKSAMGLLEEAVADYSEALSVDPDHAHAYVNRGVTKKELGLLEEAIKDYDLAITLLGADAKVYENRGNANSAMGRVHHAIKDYDIAIELNPRNADAYGSRGLAKLKLGQFSSALDDHRKAAALEPENGEHYALLGVCKAEQGELREALKDLDLAVDLKGTSANVYNNRGYIRQKLGRYTEALDDYGRAKELEPDAASVYFACARVWDALGQTGSAAEERKLGDEIWERELNSRMLRATQGALEGLAGEEALVCGLSIMERVISVFVELLHEPVEERRGRVSMFRFKEQNIETAMVLKIMQALSTLNARKLLLEGGFATEHGMLCRVYEEVIEDILFLVSGRIRGQVSPDHERYLLEFYRDSIDEDGQIVKSRQAWLPRKRIWKYIESQFAQSEIGGKTPDDEGDSMQVFLKSVHQLSSGYVHAHAANIMVMYDGEEKHFRMRGQRDDEVEEKTDVGVLLVALEMLIGCAACVGKVLGGQVWYDCIWKLEEDLIVARVRDERKD